MNEMKYPVEKFNMKKHIMKNWKKITRLREKKILMRERTASRSTT